MANQQQAFNELQKKSLESAMRLAQLSIENSQRIMELQVGTAKALFEEGVENAKALTAARDPQDVLNLRSAFAQNTTERMLACAREIAEITAKTQSEVGRLVTEQLSTGSTDVFEAMQKMFQGMPIADHNALNAFQSAVDSARTAFEQVAKASSSAFQAFTQAAPKTAAGGKR